MKLGTYKWKDINQPRKRGRYSRHNHFTAFCARVWYLLKVGTIATLTGAFLVFCGAIGFSSNKVEATVTDSMPAQVEKLKAEVVSVIASCEVPGYKETQAPIILDSNNKMSIGPMMFQVATVIHYEKLLYGKDVTALEATTIALDATQAKALATDIMFKDAKGVGNWYNCANKTGVKAKIEVIKELEK